MFSVFASSELCLVWRSSKMVTTGWTVCENPVCINLCFLVCFEMGITEWAGLCECVRGGVIAESTGHPTELTVPLCPATLPQPRG